MSLNPLNVLKRKLEDEATPLPKRLRLAKNLVHTHYFPTAPKERVISVWLEDLLNKNKLSPEEFRSVLGWLTTSDSVSAELKTKLVDLTLQYVSHHLQDEDIPYILNFIEDEKIAPQLNTHIQKYCLITKTILKQLKDSINENRYTYSNRILNSLVKLYKDSKKKLEFIVKVLEGDNLETIFDYLDYPECKNSVKYVCETLLFPMSKKSFFTVFLRTLLQKESIDELLSEKGDNIQAVLKVMSAFFTFPSGRTSKNHGFVQKFIYTFVSSFKTESQLIFAFYIMVASSLNIEQSYMSPAMKMPVIIFEGNDEKIKRTIFLNMLEVLQEYEIDIGVKLTETLSGNKIHIKKNFTSFLQSLMISQLKLEGKTDKTTLQIIKTILKLDPSLIDQKLDKILPPIMVSKKNSSQMESYTETLNCLLEILFKLSRGTVFLNQMLPHLKIILEACNTEQFELQQKIKESDINGEDCEKIKAKIINGSDIFPSECVEMYGKLTADLMFRQNSELLLSIQKDFEEHCLMMLEDGFVSPSIITLSHVTAAILSSFLAHNKMADASAPRACADEFWTALGSFEKDTLRRFGECCLKLNHNADLTNSFLQLSINVARLKLLSHNYSSCTTQPLELCTSAVCDVGVLLPSLTSEQWMGIAERCRGTECEGAWDNLLLLKATAAELISVRNPQENADLISNTTKTHLIKELSNKINVLYENPDYLKILYSNVDAQQSKLLAKILIKEVLNNPESNLLNNDVISTNRCLLNALLEETIRNLVKILENSGNTDIKISKELNKTGFDFVSFVSSVNNVPEYFEKLSTVDSKEDLTRYLDVLKQLQIHYLGENYQLLAIFVLLALKRATESKKTRKNIDYLMQAIFELSPKHPDIYKVFTIEYVFDFETKTFLDLVTLKIKTTNPLLITKSLLETAVRKVKTNAEIVKILVKNLLNNQKVKKENANLEYFSDKVFQISCLILPIIAKEKRAITSSNFRSILAELQEKLYKSLLKSFKSINFSNEKSQFLEKAGNPEDSVVISENTMATLNAMEAFSLTLSKYCETTDAEDVKNLDYLWSGLEYFVRNAITSLQSRESKPQHVESSVQLLNVVLRNMKKLESHDLFNKRDVIFVQMWAAVKARLLLIFEGKPLAKPCGDGCLEEMAVTAKLLCELVSVDAFVGHFVGDLFNLMILKKPSIKSQDEMALLTAHETAKFLWTAALKSNAIEQKCLAMCKSMYRTCKNMAAWVRANFDGHNLESELSRQSGGQGHQSGGQSLQSGGQGQQSGGQSHQSSGQGHQIGGQFHQSGGQSQQSGGQGHQSEGQSDGKVGETFVDDAVCEILRIDLDIITSVVLAAKKIPLNAKFLDAIFSCLHLVLHIAESRLGLRSHCRLIEGAVAVLSSLLAGREELLEDRWACFLQCYRGCVRAVCAGAADSQLDSPLDSQLDSQVDRPRDSSERLAKLAHAIEKLTQSMSKRKAHISRLAAYTVGDICSWIEKSGPTRLVRQHLENSVALLIQASDSTYAMAFLRRALAGSPGQMTMANMYSMYKRYHKYVGNA